MLGELYALTSVRLHDPQLDHVYFVSLLCYISYARPRSDPSSFSLYSQNINLYLAPTADARDTWLPLLRTIALEGRCFVLSANQCLRTDAIPSWTQNPPEPGTSAASTRLIGAPETGGKPGLRRRSTVTKTEDNHEIIWPKATSGDNTPKKRRPSVIYPVGPHELVLPTGAVSLDSSAIEEDKSHSALSGTSSSAASVSAVDKDKALSDVSSDPPFACRGGSCIVHPTGAVLAGPLWEDTQGLLIAEVDFEDCVRGRLDFDAAGSYSRSDAFELKVRGLQLDPPI